MWARTAHGVAWAQLHAAASLCFFSFACIAAIGRMPNAGALQHLRSRDATNYVQAGGSNNARDNHTKQLDDTDQREGKPPLVIGAGLPPVSAKLVKQIQSGQYIDLAVLLPDREDQAGSPLCDDRQKPKPKHISTVLEWLQGFTTYMAVIIGTQPERAQDLLGYQAVIIDASMRYEGRGWMGYDRRFRQIAAADPTKKWSSLDSDLWNMSFAGLARRSVCCQHCLMPSHTSEECVWSSSQQGPPLLKKSADITFSWEAPVCKSWNFSQSQDCSFQGCKFQHMCRLDTHWRFLSRLTNLRARFGH